MTDELAARTPSWHLTLQILAVCAERCFPAPTLCAQVQAEAGILSGAGRDDGLCEGKAGGAFLVVRAAPCASLCAVFNCNLLCSKHASCVCSSHFRRRQHGDVFCNAVTRRFDLVGTCLLCLCQGWPQHLCTHTGGQARMEI